MKTHFTSHEIAHVWAHKSAPHGKSPGAVSFDGNAIYSYGTVIARHVEHKGRAAVIYNATSYSVSTTKHQSRIRSAIPSDVPVFRVSGQPMGARLSFDGKGLFEHYIAEATRYEADASNARMTKTKEKLHAQAGSMLEQAKRVVEFFNLRKKVDEKAIARFAAAKVREEKRKAKEEKQRQAAYWKENEEKHAAWLRGENPGYYDASAFPVAFRVQGDELISSLGARVPMQAARLAYRFATSKRGQAWRENGETCPVGNYRLNAINEHGIVAGCHRISWEEIERLAPVLA